MAVAPPSLSLERCPLTVLVSHVLGPVEEENYVKATDESIHGQRWRKATHNWRRCCDLMKDDWRSSEFQSILSSHQRLSFQNLYEWLEGSYQPEHLSQAAKQAIGSDDYAPETGTDQPLFPSSALTQSSRYHFWMANLWLNEFLDSNLLWEFTETYASLIEDARRRSNRWAAAQRIAWTVFRSSMGLPQRQSKNRVIAESCPWLPKSKERPYYLWHIQNKCTVEAENLDVEWTCVSHTWGRWRTNQYTSLGGVPWRVPNNTLFRVDTLPDHFLAHQASFPTPYLWFDLFCIPQEPETPVLGDRAKIEIARQAQIFSGAKSCMAWFSYITDWGAEGHAINWLSFAFLRMSNDQGLYDVEGFLDQERPGADYPVQLMKHPKHMHFLGNTGFHLPRPWTEFLEKRNPTTKSATWYQPSVWFSSLWTLQEACLCPHMNLVDRDFQPLTYGQTPISLDDLFTITEMTAAAVRPDVYEEVTATAGIRDEKTSPREKWPLGACQLADLVTTEQMSPGYNSRTNVLIQGNTRQCTGRRAEAIMSVIGATDWFKTDQPEEDLVLGMYPLAFVKEAAQKIGPQFYLARKKLALPIYLVLLRHKSVGSMLPFSALDGAYRNGKHDVFRPFFECRSSSIFPSILSWVHTKEGHVQIREANVLDSSDPRYKADAKCTLMIEESADKHSDMIEFQQWLKAESSIFYTYAVQLTKEVGIVLRGLRLGPSRPKRLVKIGTYEIWSEPEAEDDQVMEDRQHTPPQKEVDWLVL